MVRAKSMAMLVAATILPCSILPGEADAAVAGGFIQIPGSACQLSIPTTTTSFRPKATGARNESTSASSFVICPVVSPLSTYEDVFVQVTLQSYSIDAQTRSMSCTATTGSIDALDGIKYSTITVGTGFPLYWFAWNFGGEYPNGITGSKTFSVTCSLPPQTAISTITGSYIYENGQ